MDEFTDKAIKDLDGISDNYELAKSLVDLSFYFDSRSNADFPGGGARSAVTQTVFLEKLQKLKG